MYYDYDYYDNYYYATHENWNDKNSNLNDGYIQGTQNRQEKKLQLHDIAGTCWRWSYVPTLTAYWLQVQRIQQSCHSGQPDEDTERANTHAHGFKAMRQKETC